jgi:HEAT repeat protein
VWALGEYDRSDLEGASLTREFARLTRDPVAAVRRQAAAIIGIHEYHEDVVALTGLLDDPTEAVRATAVWALGEMEAPELLRPATALHTDSSAVVRRAVAQAMYRAPHGNWRPLLMTLSADADPDVRATASWVLTEI